MAGQRQQRLSVLRFLVEGNSLLLASPENKKQKRSLRLTKLKLNPTVHSLPVYMQRIILFVGTLTYSPSQLRIVVLRKSVTGYLAYKFRGHNVRRSGAVAPEIAWNTPLLE